MTKSLKTDADITTETMSYKDDSENKRDQRCNQKSAFRWKTALQILTAAERAFMCRR